MLPLQQLSQSTAGLQLFSGVNSMCKHLPTDSSLESFGPATAAAIICNQIEIRD